MQEKLNLRPSAEPLTKTAMSLLSPGLQYLGDKKHVYVQWLVSVLWRCGIEQHMQ